MTAREAAHRYSTMGKRAAVGFATTLLHHWLGHDPFWRHAAPSNRIIHAVAHHKTSTSREKLGLCCSYTGSAGEFRGGSHADVSQD